MALEDPGYCAWVHILELPYTVWQSGLHILFLHFSFCSGTGLEMHWGE